MNLKGGVNTQETMPFFKTVNFKDHRLIELNKLEK